MHSIFMSATNATKATAKIAGAAVIGQKILVSEIVQALRSAICEDCKFNVASRCQKCGCSTCGEILNKTKYATEECPMGYWKKIS